jgi:hypothetical protein
MEYQNYPADPANYLPHTTIRPFCTGCQRHPEAIPDIVILAKMDEMTPSAWVIAEEGTLNPDNGHFLCNECYIRAGMPAGGDGYGGPGRWVAP